MAALMKEAETEEPGADFDMIKSLKKNKAYYKLIGQEVLVLSLIGNWQNNSRVEGFSSNLRRLIHQAHCLMKGKSVVRYSEADPEAKCEESISHDFYPILVVHLYKYMVPIVNERVTIGSDQMKDMKYSDMFDGLVNVEMNRSAESMMNKW